MIAIKDLPNHDPAAPILTVQDLSVTFESHEGDVPAVDTVSFDLMSGETLCILGESGSGKSVTQMAVMGLLSTPPARIFGSAKFQGTELIGAPKEVLSAVRGTGLSMIFQDAITSLNPALRVGYQIAEVYCARTGASRAEGRKRAIQLMEQVAIPAAKERVNDYPFQFSGGMCQRIMIAIALALNPKVLIADEPTTALDVTVQRQVMDLLRQLSKDLNLALILITHDLGVAAEQADKLMVMYAGRAVETGPTDPVFANPRHPYTAALLASMPDMAQASDRLGIIAGSPPVLSQLPKGCAFYSRCSYAVPACSNSRPELTDSGVGRQTACLKSKELYTMESGNV